MNTLRLFFYFPYGGVWSNIIASVIWTTPSFILGLIIGHRRLVRQMKQHHQETLTHLKKIHKKIR